MKAGNRDVYKCCLTATGLVSENSNVNKFSLVLTEVCDIAITQPSHIKLVRMPSCAGGGEIMSSFVIFSRE